MTIRTVLAALAVAILPGLAAAMGCSGTPVEEQTAQTCVVGTAWDAEAGACLPVATS